MKTAATVILVIALIGLIPKKKKQSPPPSTGPVTSAPAQPRSCPAQQSEDPAIHVNRIVAHAKNLTRRRGADEGQLRVIAETIVKYANTNCIEPELGASLIARESAYNPRATSPSGACGLGQMLPSTARKMGASDCYDIDQNLRASLAYFRLMLDMWDSHGDQVDRALASYLMGPGTVKNHGGVPWGNSTVKRYLSDIYSYRDSMLSN